MIDSELRKAATDLRLDIERSEIPPPSFVTSSESSRSFVQPMLVAAVILAAIAGGILLVTRDAGIETIETDPAGTDTDATLGEANSTEDSPVADSPAVAEVATPTDLQWTLTGGTISLSWSPAANADGYNLYRNGDYYTTVFESAFVEEALPPGDYQYYLFAFDESKTVFSEQSQTVTAVVPGSGANQDGLTQDEMMLQEVQLLRASSDHPTISGTVLTWQDEVNSNIHGYNIYRDGDYLSSVEAGPIASYSFTDPTQSEFTGAQYRVQAVREDADEPEGFQWGPFATAEWQPWVDVDG